MAIVVAKYYHKSNDIWMIRVIDHKFSAPFLCQKQMHIEGANDAPVLHDVQNVFICTAYMLSTPTFYAAQNCETEFSKRGE